MRYSGIVHITGESDTGKTTCALQNAHPSKTVYFHDDVKLPPVPPDAFGLFVDCVQEAQGLKLLEFRQFLLKKLAGIKPGQFDAIVFDTWTRAGLAFRQYAVLNPQEFREAQTFSKLGSAKGGEQWGEANRYEAEIISQLSRLAPFVGLVTHLKDAYEGGVRSGKQVPDSGKVLNRVCNFRIWLKHNSNSGVPIGLVLKRMNEPRITEAGLEVVNVLPWKLVPNSEDKSIWDIVDRYRQNPYGNRAPTAEEMPDEFELSILTGVMTNEQKEIWRANLDDRKEADREAKELVTGQENEIRLKIREMRGASLPEVNEVIQQMWPNSGWDLARISQEMMK